LALIGSGLPIANVRFDDCDVFVQGYGENAQEAYNDCRNDNDCVAECGNNANVSGCELYLDTYDGTPSCGSGYYSGIGSLYISDGWCSCIPPARFLP
jgi:hypothetical protein